MERPSYEDSVAGSEKGGVENPESNIGIVKHSADGGDARGNTGTVIEHFQAPDRDTSD